MSRVPSIEEVRHAIARAGDVRQVKQWVNSGVLDVNRKIQLGQNALHVAAWCHQVEMIEAIIQAGGDVNIQSDCVGWTALHWVMYGMYNSRYDRAKSAVFTLLNAGCNPNICDNWGMTALHRVVDVSNHGRNCSQEKIQVIMEVVQMLIDAGTDITIKNKKGKTALDLSKRETVSNLLKKKLAEVAQASCRQQLKKQAAEATQAYVKSLPDPPDSVEVLLKLTQEQGNREPDIEFVQARVSSQFDDTLPVAMEGNDEPSMVGRQLHFGRQRNTDRTECADSFKSFVASLSSVGYLQWSNGFQGSAFCVGDKYVMTNYHVVEENAPTSVAEETNKMPKRFIVFNFDRPFGYGQRQGFISFPLKWSDPQLDIAILELSTNTPNPPPLVRFAKLDKHKHLHFGGHPSGGAKQVDVKCKIVSQHEDLVRWSMAQYGVDYYAGAADPTRVLYNLSENFIGGSSGSPGFIADHNQDACVAAIHTYAYPNIPHNVTSPLLDKRVEQGVRIEFIYEKLLQQNPGLCGNVFPHGRPY